MSTLKSKIEQRDELVELKSTLNESLKEVNERLRGLDKDIMSDIQELGADRINMNGKTYQAQEKIVFQASDWDEFYDHLIETKQLYLLQRRLSTKALLELLDLGELPPGIEPVEITELAVRKST